MLNFYIGLLTGILLMCLVCFVTIKLTEKQGEKDKWNALFVNQKIIGRAVDLGQIAQPFIIIIVLIADRCGKLKTNQIVNMFILILE